MEEDFQRVKLLPTITMTVQPFNLSQDMTDASRLYGIRFTLLQPQPKEKLSLIQCGSVSLTPTQTRYTTIKLECIFSVVFDSLKLQSTLFASLKLRSTNFSGHKKFETFGRGVETAWGRIKKALKQKCMLPSSNPSRSASVILKPKQDPHS